MIKPYYGELRRNEMRLFYKLFVSDKEVINNLPLFMRKNKSESELKQIFEYIRKHLFFRKIKKFLSTWE